MAEMDKRKAVEIKLDFPVQLADRLLDKVTMRRPTIGDLLKHNINGPNYQMKDDIAFYSDLCGIVPDEMEQLDFTDYEKIQGQFFRFRGISRPGRVAANGY